MRRSTILVLAIAAVLLIALNVVSLAAGFGLGWYGRGSRDRSTASVASAPPSPTPIEESGWAASPTVPPAEQSTGLDVLLQAWDFVERDYYSEEPVDNAAVNYGAIRGLLGALNDPHTRFVEPPQAELDKSGYEGKFGGIGAYISTDEDGRPFISAVIPGNPAEAAGLMDGDAILAVDGEDVQGLTQDEVVLKIRGPIDTVVTLTVQRAGAVNPIEIRVRRAEIKLPTVSWEPIDGGQVAHIKLEFFASPTSQELEEALHEIAMMDIAEIILDLRANRGGLLSSAGEVAGQFIDGGVLLYERRRGDNSGSEIIEEAYMIPRMRGTETKAALVVLVDAGTASASEIVAGAIQDYARGILIGEATFGKGSMQYVHELSDGSSLHVTAAHWLTPNKRPINGTGLAPDIEVALTQDDLDAGRDPQLEQAIAYLAGRR